MEHIIINFTKSCNRGGNRVMVKLKIRMEKPDDLTMLNAAASAMPFDIDASSGWYIADAKSLVGLFGLKLYTDWKTAEPFLLSIRRLIL